MNITPTRSGWLMASVILVALDEVAMTLPAGVGVHLSQAVEFVIAVVALVAGVLAYFANGSRAP